jgi:hypothetical protein
MAPRDTKSQTVHIIKKYLDGIQGNHLFSVVKILLRNSKNCGLLYNPSGNFTSITAAIILPLLAIILKYHRNK